MNIGGQNRDDEDDDGRMKSQGPRTIDEFLLIVNQSDEWMTTFCAIDDVRKKNIYHGVWLKIEEMLQENNISKFKELVDIMVHLNKAFNNDLAPLQYAYCIILSARRYDRQEIMKHFMGKVARILDKTSASAACDKAHDKVLDLRKAFYNAIRLNNVDILEALIEYTSSASTDLYDSLAKSYELLRSKNVPIIEEMKIFVEDRLTRERFLRDVVSARDASMSESDNTSTAGPDTAADTSTTTAPEVYVCKIINFIIDAVNSLTKVASFDDQRVSIALFIARNIRVLKGQLKPTVNQRPWTEMEFCLVCYSSLLSFEKKQLHRRLEKLINKPKECFGITDTSKNNDEVLQKINRYLNGKLTIDWENVEDYEAFHNDYELVKDVYSLNKMLRYIASSLSVKNPESQTGKLIIERTLHVIGECVKNSLASPNLSTSAQETFIFHQMGGGIEVAPPLRDILSHADKPHVLLLRNNIQNQQGFFTQLQEDLKRAHVVVVYLSCFAKIKRFERCCEDIVLVDDTQEFQGLCEELLVFLCDYELPDVEAPEINALTKAKSLLTSIWNEVNEDEKKSMKTDIEDNIAEIKELIDLERKGTSEVIKKFNQVVKSVIYSLNSHAMEYRSTKCTNIPNTTKVTEQRKMFIKNLSTSFEIIDSWRVLATLMKINSLLEIIHTNVKEISACQKIHEIIFEVRKTLYTNRYGLMFTAIEEFEDKIKTLEPAITNTDSNAERKLDKAFEVALRVLDSEKKVEKFTRLQSLLKKNKIIHQLKSKFKDPSNGTYREVPSAPLTLCERAVVESEQSKPYSKGKHLLSKSTDYYGKLLANKIDVRKFATLFLSEEKHVMTFIDIFNGKESPIRNCTPKDASKKVDQVIEEKLLKNMTKKEYDDSSAKFAAIKNDHKVRPILAEFFNFAAKSSNAEIKLEKMKYEELVANLNTRHDIKQKLKNLYEFMTNEAVIVESLYDLYGPLVNTVKNKESTAKQICESYVAFFTSLEWEDTKTRTLLSRAVIKNEILSTLEEQFIEKLNRLEKTLGNVETREAKYTLIARYTRDIKLQAVVEMLLLDLYNISIVIDGICDEFMASNGIPLKFLERGFLHLDASLPFLTENPFRNYLAHGDVLIDGLPYFDTTMAVISCAIIFCEEGKSLIALRYRAEDKKMDKNQLNEKSNTFKSPVKMDYYTSCEKYLSECCNPNPLLTAATAGNKQDFLTLLERGEDVRTRNDRMRTLLHVAANKGHEDIVETLLDSGIGIDARDHAGRTPLHLAARNGHCPVVEVLLKNRAKVDAVDSEKITPLHHAAFLEDTAEVAHILLKYGANCNAGCDNDLTPLHAAALSGNLNVIKLFVAYNKTNGVIADNSNKSLQMAILGTHDNTEVFEYLLRNVYYNTNSKNSKSSSKISETDMRCLLQVAAIKGSVKMVKALLKYGADAIDLVLDDKGFTALHYASQRGHTLLAKFLIEKKAKVDLKCSRQCGNLIPLHLAAISGSFEIVKDFGTAHINTPSNDGSTALHLAVSDDHLNIAKYLVAKGALKNPFDRFNRSPLHFWAARGYDFKTADYLIDVLKIDIEGQKETKETKETTEKKKTQRPFTPLMLAVCKGKFSNVKYFVEKRNAQVNVRDKNGATLLHYAVSRYNLQLVKYLSQKIGENVNEILCATDVNGDNVLQNAVSLGHTEIVKTLLELGKDKIVGFVNTCNVFGQTPLYYAVILCRAYLVETLLEYGADANAENNPDWLPLAYAATYGYTTIVKILLRNGADPNRKTTDGETPLSLACYFNERDVIGILLKAGANVNSTNDDGRTPLHVAAIRGCLYAATALVNRSARIDAVDNDGRMPLQYAYHFGNTDVYQLFISHLLKSSGITYSFR